MANSRTETRKMWFVWEKIKGEKGYLHSLKLSQPPQVPITYCGDFYTCPQTPSYASLQGVELSSLSFECGLNDSPSKIIERKNRNFSVEKLAGQHLNQVIKFSVASGKACWYWYPVSLVGWNGKNILLLSCSSSKSMTPVYSWGKKKKILRLRDILQCVWLICLRSVKVMKNKERLKNCHRPNIMTRCHMLSWSGKEH